MTVRFKDGPTIGSMPLYGIERALGEDDTIPEGGDQVAFRCYDDDGELTHSGSLDDDDECINQSAALRWAEADAGATVIKVKRGNEWTQEIA